MRRKSLVIIILFVVLFTGILGAKSDGPSTFDMGLISYYRLSDITETNFAAYTPALRLQVNITDWFGLSAETMYEFPLDTVTTHRLTLTTDMVFRLPIGFFEPFLALGPGYLVTIDQDSTFEFVNSVIYNFRAGFDFNITDVFTLGIEGNLLIPSMVDFFTNLATLDGPYFMENTLVAIGLKVKL
jgi:hypothetical protein